MVTVVTVMAIVKVAMTMTMTMKEFERVCVWGGAVSCCLPLLSTMGMACQVRMTAVLSRWHHLTLYSRDGYIFRVLVPHAIPGYRPC